MKVKELLALVGTERDYPIGFSAGCLTIRVRIVSAYQPFGNAVVVVEPIHGTGQASVRYASLNPVSSLTVDLCPRCEQPTHATEGNDEGVCVPCLRIEWEGAR
jgi:hypothetical protein